MGRAKKGATPLHRVTGAGGAMERMIFAEIHLDDAS